MANDASTVFDLVILGGGSGGYAAALRAAQLGLDVALRVGVLLVLVGAAVKAR